MGLYLGNKKVKLSLGNKTVRVFIEGISQSPETPSKPSEGARLISSDNFVLTDKNGVYLTSKESE